jgi:predicted MFS family arabinose efflux permease
LVAATIQIDVRVGLLAVGAFAVGTDSFVIAGLLPDLATTYHVGLPVAGQLVTAYALCLAIFAPMLATFTCKLSRARVLVVGLLIFALANLAGALATHFTEALLARGCAGLGAGLFTPTASAMAAELVAPNQKHRALSTVMLGLSVATAIGSPLGVFLAPSIGWRNILLAIALLSASLALAIGLLFPHLGQSSPLSLRERIRPLGTSRVALILGSTFLALTGLYVTYTYSSIVFGKATDDQPSNLALLLATWGIAGTVGSVLGRTAARFGDRTIVNVALAALVFDFCFIYVAGTTFYGAIVGVAIWGICGWAFVIPQQHRLISAAPQVAPVLIALHLTAVYAGTSLSGVVGAVALQLVSPITLTLVSGALVLLGWVASEVLFTTENLESLSYKRPLAVPPR